MNKNFLLILSFITVLISSCYYEAEEDLFPPQVCNPGTVTFSGTINGLLNSYGCTGCHVGPSPSGNFTLLNYDDVKAKVDDGKLWGAINHMPGFSPMPDGAAKMNQCDINKIRAWMDAGAPNN